MENEQKTRNILIVGNGFDLAHGLPTKYKDFIDFMTLIKKMQSQFDLKHMNSLGVNESYTFLKSEISFDTLFIRDLQINNHISTGWYKSQLRLEKKFFNNLEKIFFNKNKFDLKNFDLDKIYGINNFDYYQSIYDNEWLNYFTELNVDKNWLDIEYEVFNALKILNSYFKSIGNSSDANLFRGVEIEKKLLNILFKKILDTNNNFKIDFKCKKLGEFELELEKVIDYLYNSFLLFTEIYKIYLLEIVEPLKKNLNANLFSKQKINNFSECFSFNYTDTPLFNSNFNFESDDIKFFHGSLQPSSKIVFGVSYDDLHRKDLDLSEFSSFSKEFQISYNQSNRVKIVDTQAKSEENKNQKVESNFINHYYLWGHSLGAADAKYFEELFKVLPSNNYKLIIYYFSNKDYTSYIKTLLLHFKDNDYGYSDLERNKIIVLEQVPAIFREYK